MSVSRGWLCSHLVLFSEGLATLPCLDYSLSSASMTACSNHPLLRGTKIPAGDPTLLLSSSVCTPCFSLFRMKESALPASSSSLPVLHPCHTSPLLKQEHFPLASERLYLLPASSSSFPLGQFLFLSVIWHSGLSLGHPHLPKSTCSLGDFYLVPECEN